MGEGEEEEEEEEGGGGDTHWVTECIYIVLQATYMHP